MSRDVLCLFDECQWRGSEAIRDSRTRCNLGPRSNFKNLRSERPAMAPNRCGPFVNMMGLLNQFVLVKARKSRGGDWWSPDDYDVRDSHGKVVGRIMLHPQAPKDQPWFWTITAREIPPSIHNRGYSATREQAMADFKMRWAATTV
jgi:hypothetical protein